MHGWFIISQKEPKFGTTRDTPSNLAEHFKEIPQFHHILRKMWSKYEMTKSFGEVKIEDAVDARGES